LRVNQGYYSPDFRSKKSSNTYMQNFQKLMTGRSKPKNLLGNQRHSPSPQSKRLNAMYGRKIGNALERKSPGRAVLGNMNSKYSYRGGSTGRDMMNGSLNLNNSNSSYNRLNSSKSPRANRAAYRG
jgi:hypothetical protein